VLRHVVRLVGGAFVLLLLMWTPKTGRDVLIFLAVLAGSLVAVAISLALKRREAGDSKETES
jgi:LPXTG-motif cell wall-anchored protein